MSTHILKQQISLQSCHIGYCSQEKKRNQSSLNSHLSLRKCSNLKTQFWVLWTSSEWKAMWRNLRPALLQSPCLLTKMIYLNSCTISLPTIANGMCFICNLPSLISVTKGVLYAMYMIILVTGISYQFLPVAHYAHFLFYGCSLNNSPLPDYIS
jgi:hypothetical protein